MEYFAIRTDSTVVEAVRGKRVTWSHTVTNVSGGPMQVRAQLVGLQPPFEGWVSITEDAVRELPVGRETVVTVEATIPKDADQEDLSCRLLICDQNDAENVVQEGPEVSVVILGEAPKKPFPWKWLAAAAGALVLVAGAWSLLQPSKVEFPDGLVGTPYDQVHEQLQALGLAVSLDEYVGLPEHEDNAVVAVSVPAGTVVTEGTVVSVSVNKTHVPDLKGLDSPAAEAKLVEAGFLPGTEQLEIEATLPEGTVLRASVTMAVPGDPVDWVVSRLPDPVSVPKLLENTLDQAKAALSSAKLTLGIVTSVVDESRAPGTVKSQSPDWTQMVQPGTQVALVLRKKRDPVTVPNLVGQVADGAKALLTSRGFSVGGITYTDDLHRTAGTVASQSPSSGKHAPGTVVSLRIYKLPATVRVPDLRNLGRSQALVKLQEVKLRLGGASTRPSTGKAGIVLEQDPPGDTALSPGSSVAVVWSAKGCPKRTVTLGNDHAFIYLDLPLVEVGWKHSWSNARIYKYVFPRCYAVAIVDYSYECIDTSAGPQWRAGGQVHRDALCHDSGAHSQDYMRVATK
jgi:beta-lactam-binding protein with PASTA domain